MGLGLASTGHVSGCLVASRLPSLLQSDLLFALHGAEGREREKRGEDRRGYLCKLFYSSEGNGADRVLSYPRGFPRTICPSWSHIADLVSAPLTPPFLLPSGREADAATEW